jgi:formate--tetrahydrofolate ligase
MEEFNLHLTGDNHAITAAHNLGAAFIDNHLHHGNKLEINPFSINWPRVMDISDRAIRKMIVGLGGKENGVPRETDGQITVASEIMAVLALTSDLQDMRKRIGRIVFANNTKKEPLTFEQLKCAGAMTVLMREAIKPNLLQTLEGGPAFVHAGPFANIAHGNSSVLADRIARKLCDVVVTEAGFGADMGAQKFFDIKCRLSGIRPAAAVMVATVRALKMHGGVGKIVAGKPLDPALLEENPDAVEKGAANLAAQIENVRKYGVPVVVAINLFPTDKPSEIEAIKKVALAAGAEAAVPSTHHGEGGKGAAELAKAVWAAVEKGEREKAFKVLYPDNIPLAQKIDTIVREIYGGEGADLGPGVAKQLKAMEDKGYGHLPVCMAKTQYSLSHDAKLLGRPKGFRVPVREVCLYAGAGFVTAICGDMRTMPGLPSTPGGENIDIDENGNIVGLF